MIKSSWDDFVSLKTRIMVASAGAGTYKDGNRIPNAGQ